MLNILKRLLTTVLLCAILYVFGLLLIHGIDKSIKIKENTYYDKELGRMIYVEDGV